MLGSFLVAFEAVTPFLCYLALGYAIVRFGLTDRPFLDRLNALNFRVFFPLLMFQNVYGASPDGLPSAKLIVLTMAALLLAVGGMIWLVPRLVREDARRGVIIQACYRSNFVLYGVPLTAFIFGEERASIAGIMTLFVISFFNISAVIVLEMFNGGLRGGLRKTLVKLAKNPLLQGCLAGLLFYLLRIRLPAFVSRPVSSLAGLATPLAMITLGGALRFGELKKNMRFLAPTLLFKLIVFPLVMLAAGYAAGLRGVELFLLAMIFGTPCAASSYTMAMNMGGDGELAGQLVFTSTVVSLFTLFAFIFCMAQLGLLT